MDTTQISESGREDPAACGPESQCTVGQTKELEIGDSLEKIGGVSIGVEFLECGSCEREDWV